MAVHDFCCSRCETLFEISRPIARFDDPVSCLACGAPARRQVSAPRFVFTKASTIDAANAAAHSNQSRANHHGHPHGEGSAPHKH